MQIQQITHKFKYCSEGRPLSFWIKGSLKDENGNLITKFQIEEINWRSSNLYTSILLSRETMYALELTQITPLYHVELSEIVKELHIDKKYSKAYLDDLEMFSEDFRNSLRRLNHYRYMNTQAYEELKAKVLQYINDL